MSVSFYPEISDKVEVVISCICGNFVVPVVFSNRAAAFESFNKTSSQCRDPYCDYLQIREFNAEPEVNLSNSNAEELLEYLGIPSDEELVGSMEAEAFLGRVIMASALAPANTGLTTMQIENFVYGGRPADYMQRKFEQLEEVARFAISHGRQVVWG